MNTKELIAALQRLDPKGEMTIVLAVDAGEGYVGLDTAFVDEMRRQPVDGDELDMGSPAPALFLGDGHAAKSEPALFRYVGPLHDVHDTPSLDVTYGELRSRFRSVSLPKDIADGELLVAHLDDLGRKIHLAWRRRGIAFAPPFVDLGALTAELERRAAESVRADAPLKGDAGGEPASIERVLPPQ